VDVTNNGGGFICIAHWLHRLIAGPSKGAVPQAGLDTKLRAGPLARKIVAAIASGNVDPDQKMMYHPIKYVMSPEADLNLVTYLMQPRVREPHTVPGRL
jgi:hypothetical protein